MARGEEAVALAVWCPFDNRPDAFTEAPNAKISKYEPVRHLAQRYQRVTVDAIIVGAVSSWYPKNDTVMHKICSPCFPKLFKKLVMSDVISALREIYQRHVAHHWPLLNAFWIFVFYLVTSLALFGLPLMNSACTFCALPSYIYPLFSFIVFSNLGYYI